jgi:hypothetical protein
MMGLHYVGTSLGPVMALHVGFVPVLRSKLCQIRTENSDIDHGPKKLPNAA